MVLSQNLPITIDGPAGSLEAVLHTNVKAGPLHEQGYCAVVCHPHPLHGGTMDNKVVSTLVRPYSELGVPSVRFNFRGTGQSQGTHDYGVGEVDDLIAVSAWMDNRYPGTTQLLAGFSFGSGVAGNGALKNNKIAHLTLVAPPVGRYGFPDKTHFPCPWTLVMGDEDELVDAQEVYRWASTMDPRPAEIRMPEATHFFHGQLVAMRSRLVETIVHQLGYAPQTPNRDAG